MIHCELGFGTWRLVYRLLGLQIPMALGLGIHRVGIWDTDFETSDTQGIETLKGRLWDFVYDGLWNSIYGYALVLECGDALGLWIQDTL